MNMDSLALLCLFTLFASTNAQFPQLLGSFSFEGSSVGTAPGIITTSNPLNVAVDISRGLEIVDSSVTAVPSVGSYEIISLLSIDDSAEYIYNVTADTCDSTNVSSTMFPLDQNIWDDFQGATEDPTGTFTRVNGTTVVVVVIINGVPASLISTTTIGGEPYIVAVNFTSYTNAVPPFSVFTLPTTCSSQFTCNACYDPSTTTMASSTTTPGASTMAPSTTTPSSAVSISSSVLLVLAAIAMFLLSTV